MRKQDLRTGDLIAFQIGEIPDFSAPNKDLWGVLKILDTGNEKDDAFSLSVKAKLWPEKPTWWQAARAPQLIERRFAKLGGTTLPPHELIFTTPMDGAIDLRNAAVIGRVFWFNGAERAARRKIRRDGHYYKFAGISHAPLSLDHEHRALNDAARWRAELDAHSAAEDRLRHDRAEREKQRLKTLTLQGLKEETPFQDWDNRAQSVPPAFTQAVRNRTQALLDEMMALGEKPRRKDVRAGLQAYVTWLNAFDGAFGYGIETEEREDLMGFVEELCWATKQKPLIDEADAWRDW